MLNKIYQYFGSTKYINDWRRVSLL